jgi:hypothetical protein
MKVQCPNREQMKPDWAGYPQWQKNLEARIKYGGTCEPHLTKAKDTQAFVTRAFHPLRISEPELGAFREDYLRRGTLGQDGQIWRKLL